VFDGGIMGVALGVVLGAILQLVVSAIGLIGLGFDYRMIINWRHKGFRQVLRLLPPRSLDQGADYFNSIVEMSIASHLGEGMMRSFQQASSLALMPVSLIGVAISNAAFPRMTERLGEGRPDLFRQELRTVLRWIIWLALPISVITFFTRGYIVAFIKNGGDYLIAGLLGALVISILFRTVYHIAARTFYAQQDTKTPLYVSIFSIALNIFLAVMFTSKFGWGVYGLAWAQSIVAVVEVMILLSIIGVRTPGIFSRSFGVATMRMTLATALMGIVTYVMVQVFQFQSDDLSFFAIFPKFLLITLTSFIVYIWICKRLKIDEAVPIVRKVNSVVFGKK